MKTKDIIKEIDQAITPEEIEQLNKRLEDRILKRKQKHRPVVKFNIDFYFLVNKTNELFYSLYEMNDEEVSNKIHEAVESVLSEEAHGCELLTIFDIYKATETQIKEILNKLETIKLQYNGKTN